MNKPQRKILIVDDSAEDRATFRRFLQQDANAAYLFEEANSGKKALTVYQTFQPDCLLLDYRLPDLDGLEFLECLYEQTPSQASAVVMLTGTGNEAVAVEAMKCGAQDYLVKGAVTPERLRYAVANAIEKVTLLRALEAQRQQLHRQAEIIDQTHDAIVITDLDGTVRSWNRGAERVFGYTAAEIIDRPVWLLFPESEREQFLTLVLGPLRERGQHELEVPQRGKLGETLYIQLKLSLSRDQAGVPTGITGYATDITTRKQAEVALQESETRFRALVNAAPTLVWAAAPDGTMTLVSDQWVEYCGLTAEQLARDWPQLVLHPDDYERCVAQWTQARAQGAGYEIEIRNRRHDGVYRWFLTRAVPARNTEGRITGWYGTTTDIHDRKLLEDELRQFSHIVSHDLHEPLRTMSSFATLLASQYQGKLDATADEYITFVTDGAERMQQMIADLLEYTRAGKPIDTFTAVDCETLMAQVLVALQVAITESDATITHDPLPTVHGDATRLGQLLQNLIGNALKFRSTAPPRIHISAQREAQHWRFGVRDNGIGIDPAQSKRLFQVFQRLHTRADYPGTGMGLAICRKIVEQHGGRMWVESTVGNGATFFFTLQAEQQR